jgi:hypothetical protein
MALNLLPVFWFLGDSTLDESTTAVNGLPAPTGEKWHIPRYLLLIFCEVSVSMFEIASAPQRRGRHTWRWRDQFPCLERLL